MSISMPLKCSVCAFCECMFLDVLECTKGRGERKERAVAEGRDRLHHLNEIWQTH